MMKSFTILAIMLLAAGSVSGKEVLSVFLTVYGNGSVELEELRVLNNNPSRFFISEGEYLLEISDSKNNRIYERNMSMKYLAVTDFSEPSDYSIVDLNIPYKSEMSVLRLYARGNLLFTSQIDVCMVDGVCGPHETYLSCSQDCPLDKKDVICIKAADGVCDPDCAKGVDPDCTVDVSGKTVSTVPEVTVVDSTLPIVTPNKKSDLNDLLGACAVVLILFLAAFVLRRGRK
jgi:hypothetical protein